MKTPDWEFWRHMPTARVWQACLLSLNIDPDSMKHSRHGWMAGPVSGPAFEPESFPSKEVENKYDKRTRLLEAHLSNRTYFKPGIISLENSKKHEVFLSDFIEWAISVMKWDGLPPELVALREAQIEKEDSALTESSASLSEENEFEAAFENNGMIDWDYWMHQLKQLSALEASCLMSVLNPADYQDLENRPHHQDTTGNILKAKEYLRAAKDHGKTSMKHAEWLAWAESIGRPACASFRLEAKKIEQSNTHKSKTDSPITKLPEETKPPVTTTVTRKISTDTPTKKSNNLLDPPINKAIKAARSLKTSAVYLELKELAKDEEPPFLGTFIGGNMLYTNIKGEQCEFTRGALDARLRRRRNKQKASKTDADRR